MDGDAPSIELRPAFGEHPPEPSLKVEPHRDVVGDRRGDFEPRLVEGRRHEVEEVRAGVGLVEIGVALAHLGKTDRDAPLLGEAEDAPEEMRVHAGTAQIVQEASDFQVGEPLPGHGELVGEGEDDAAGALGVCLVVPRRDARRVAGAGRVVEREEVTSECRVHRACFRRGVSAQ